MSRDDIRTKTTEAWPAILDRMLAGIDQIPMPEARPDRFAAARTSGLRAKLIRRAARVGTRRHLRSLADAA